MPQLWGIDPAFSFSNYAHIDMYVHIYVHTMGYQKKKKKMAPNQEPALFIQFKVPGLRTSSFANDPSLDCNSKWKKTKSKTELWASNQLFMKTSALISQTGLNLKKQKQKKTWDRILPTLTRFTSSLVSDLQPAVTFCRWLFSQCIYWATLWARGRFSR